MGKRGPAGKPHNVRLLHGDRQDRLEQSQPKLPVTLPEYPEDMPEAGRPIWDDVVEKLELRGTLSSVDGPSLETYVFNVLVFRDCRRLVQEKGTMVKGYRNSLVKNPALTPMRDAGDKIRAFAREFGLTPSSRADVQIPEGPPDGKSASRFFS